MKKVGIIVGSLRKDAFSKQVAKNTAEKLNQYFETEFIEIGNLPYYNQDLEVEGSVPQAWTDFRNTVKNVDAILFVTPEYNRSLPAVVKNALDVGSRPMADSVWNKKPAAIISNSPGNIGGFGANHHLRQTLAFLNMPVLGQPEVYLSQIHTLLQEDGTIVEGTSKFLDSFVLEFKNLIDLY